MSIGLDRDIAQGAERLDKELSELIAGCESMRAELARDGGFCPAHLAKLWEAMRFGPRLGAAAELGKLRCWMAARSMVAGLSAPLPQPGYEQPAPRRFQEWQDGDVYGGRQAPEFEYRHPQHSPCGKAAAYSGD